MMKWYVKLLFWLQRKKYGYVLNSSKVWAESPPLFLALSHLYGAFIRKSSPVSEDLRKLILYYVSELNCCAFCIGQNSKGISSEKRSACKDWKTSDLFSEHEKLVLEYTCLMTDSGQCVTDSMRAKLSEHFSRKEIVEITALIAFQNMSTKFNNALNVPRQEE